MRVSGVSPALHRQQPPVVAASQFSVLSPKPASSSAPFHKGFLMEIRMHVSCIQVFTRVCVRPYWASSRASYTFTPALLLQREQNRVLGAVDGLLNTASSAVWVVRVV